MDLVIEKYGKVDILVNNAGILEEGLKPIDRFSDEDLDRIIETNEKELCVACVLHHRRCRQEHLS